MARVAEHPPPAAPPRQRVDVLERLGTRWREGGPSAFARPLHWASLAVAAGFLLWVDRHQWFSGDEWDFIVNRGVVGHPLRSVWEPHNEHWTTVPILVYRALFAAFGVRTYVPYLVVVIALHLLVAHLLWRLLLRAGLDPFLVTGATAAFLFVGVGWENLVNAFQMTLVAPLALGLAALLLMPRRGGFQRRDAYGWACNVIALMCSGLGVTMLLIVTFAALLRRGWRVAVLTLSLPGVVYLAWYAKYGRHAHSVDQEPLGTALQKAPQFVWRGLGDAIDGFTGLAGIAPVVLVLLAIWLVRAARPRAEPWPDLVALALGAPVFLFLVDIRRSGLGAASAGSSRYSYVVIAMLLPAAAMAAWAVVSRSAVRAWIVVAAVGALLLVGIPILHDRADVYAAIKQENERRIVAALQLLRDHAPLASDVPAPEFIPDLHAAQLLALSRAGKLPGNVHVTPADQLTAAEFLQVSVGPSAAGGFTASPSVVGAEGATLTAAPRPGCVDIAGASDRPTLLLTFGAPGSVQITTGRSGTFDTQLQLPDADGATRGRGRTWKAEGGTAQTLTVTATKPWLRLRLPADGPSELCGVASTTTGG